MSRDEYLKRIIDAYDNGEISDATYELLITNMDLITK